MLLMRCVIRIQSLFRRKQARKTAFSKFVEHRKDDVKYVRAVKMV